MGRGRGVSSGGGQSSLGYLFGGGETAPVKKPAPETVKKEAAAAAPSTVEKMKGIPAGIHSTQSNNYFRAQGQNCGNFLTDRPSTKVHAAPGGGSSLDYLFGGNSVILELLSGGNITRQSRRLRVIAAQTHKTTMWTNFPY
uniref:Protein SPIRAL1-like 1 n=1 Tax=Leersia perrieri TaxID=77586 RepID=A0A0D9XUC2_9ORYZ